MTVETLISIVLILLLIIVLAFMASQLDIDITPQKDSLLPNIKIKFSKDNSLFSFLRSDKEKKVDTKNSDEPFINKYFHGKAIIQYGDSALTTAQHEITIQAQQDGCDEYFYFNTDSNALIRREFGFTEIDTDSKRIREFETWDATVGTGVFSNLNRVIFAIRKLRIGQELKLRYALEMLIHYKEVLTLNTDITYHHYFFRLLNTTENAVFEFHLPKGIESKCVRCDFIIEYNNNILLNYSCNINEGIFELPRGLGNIWIRIDNEKIYIQWSTNKQIPQGSIYKLRWFTEKLN
jgi:hypothetical protein